MSELSLALQSFGTAVKELANGLTHTIMFFLQIFGIRISPQLAGLIFVVCVAYAISMILRDEMVKKIIFILIALALLGYIGVNLDTIIPAIMQIIGLRPPT